MGGREERRVVLLFSRPGKRLRVIFDVIFAVGQLFLMGWRCWSTGAMLPMSVSLLLGVQVPSSLLLFVHAFVGSLLMR